MIISSICFWQKLLDAGADKDSLDNGEMTPVMWACHFDKYENMELLLNISHDDEMRFEIIDAEMKDKDQMGRNLLHWSISNSLHKQCFKVCGIIMLLLKHDKILLINIVLRFGILWSTKCNSPT